MQALSAAESTSRPACAIEYVAVVATDALIVRRIRDAVSRDSITLGEQAADTAGLSDITAGAVAILLAGAGRPGESRAIVRAVTGRFPSVPVVVIAPPSRNGVRHAVEAGAAGYVFESRVEESLAVALQAVRRGLIVLPRNGRRPTVRAPLTHRERETLGLVMQGLTNRQIAARLFLAESTVKTHLTSIFGKLGVASRSEAVALALDPDEKLGLGALGLVPPSATAGTPGNNAP